MKITKLALLSYLVGFLAAVPTTDAAAVYVVYPAAGADDEDGLATLSQTPNDENEVGDAIAVLRKGGESGGVGVVGGVGGGRSSKRCKSGKNRKTLSCGDDVFGKVRLIEGLNCPGLAGEDTAITVTKGATLDCGGNTIFGPGSGDITTGIIVKEGGIVRNCKVVGFGIGIRSTGPSTITNCVISNVISALDYSPNTSSLKDKCEAKNIYITESASGIFISPNGNTNKFKFDSVTIANPTDTSGIFVIGDMGGSSLTFNKITSAAEASFDEVEGSGATIKIKSSIFDGAGVSYAENGSGTNNDIKLSIEKTLIINAPEYGIDFDPVASSSSTLDVTDSSVALSGGSAGVFVSGGTATLDSVESSGNFGNGLSASNADVTAKNTLVQFNKNGGISTGSRASVNVNDSKVCKNVQDDISGKGAGPALNNVVCGKASSGIGVTCPNQSGNCTADEEVATTSCD